MMPGHAEIADIILRIFAENDIDYAENREHNIRINCGEYNVYS
jgi:hypothetical protein